LSNHLFATADILHPDPDLVRTWTGRIHHLRREKTAERLVKDKRDAEALVQVLLLNSASHAADDGSRYVLLTADGDIHRAYGEWFWGEENELCDFHVYALRHPIQYVPMLNVTEMPTRVEVSGLFRQMSIALDLLFAPIAKADPRYPGALTYYGARIAEHGDYVESLSSESAAAYRHFFGTDPFALDAGAATEVVEKWRSSFADSAILPASYLSTRDRSTFESLSKLLYDREDLRNALLDHLGELVQEVEISHLAIGAVLSPSAIISASGMAPATPGRGPLPIRVDFKTLFGEDLDLHSSRIPTRDIAAIERKLREVSKIDAFMFAAVVAFRCAMWDVAHAICERIIPMIPKEQDEAAALRRLEVEHLLATALRFKLFSRVELLSPEGTLFKRADALLAKAAVVCKISGDGFGAARAITERATLRMGYAFKPAGRIDGELEALVHELDQPVSEFLEEAGKEEDYQPEGRWAGAMRVVSVQHAITVLCTETYRRLRDRREPKLPEAILDAADAKVARELERPEFPRHLQVDFWMTRWLRAKNGAEGASSAKKISELLQQFEHRTLSGDHTSVDDLILRQYRVYFDARCSATPALS
jgi:hypothetical protein